ncbi:MAG: hypothetical protein FJZ38_20845 [Candidatus Rokubacteria bacterium]|nr:hypothetical protein [Candidatus Rokubacteria bacterium]
MARTLTGDGLFVPERAAPLTRALFDELTARVASFTLTVDYRDLPPPLEELDLVTLRPCAATAVPGGDLVLRPVEDGFVFTRENGTAPEDRLARVTRVERPGSCIDLERGPWRMIGRLLASHAAVRATWAAAGRACSSSVRARVERAWVSRASGST